MRFAWFLKNTMHFYVAEQSFRTKASLYMKKKYKRAILNFSRTKNTRKA